ncbi:MAG: pseudouridine synthase [Sandaracinaceae bacterium]|nr:pseudouridine synthase [Sandaracinaceae bacterium]
MALERLQKILAHAGVASRRAAEELIVNGHVRVNGRIVTELGARADTRNDRVEVDGKRLVAERHLYFMFHKPRAMVTTMHDPEGRPSLVDVFGSFGTRLYPVGRLDFHTSGALLVTNDGDLTDALLHPRHGVPKEYVAKVRGHLDVKALQALRTGVRLDDGRMTKPANVFVIREEDATTWLQITITEGQNRQIHRMGDAVGHPVMRLSRVSFAGISTEDLRPGDFRELTDKELEKLKKDYGDALHRAPRRETDGSSAPVKKRSGGGSGAGEGAPRERAPRGGEERGIARGRDAARKPAARAKAASGKTSIFASVDERMAPMRERARAERKGPLGRGRGDDRKASPSRGKAVPSRGRDDVRKASPPSRARDDRKPASGARSPDRKPSAATRGTSERKATASREPRAGSRPAKRSDAKRPIKKR